MDYKTHIHKVVNPKQLKFLGRITEGGVAEILTALDGYGRQVVVRQLREDMKFNFRMRRHFLNGVAIRRKLGTHRNIVQYLGEGGPFLRPYEVIEYIPGDSLKALIGRRHHILHEKPVEILMQAAAAMIHTHFRGFLHLDIKPENFLVKFRGDEVELKLTDFDLCQPVTKKRAPRHFGGSLVYMPPEYLSRKAISVNTDFFAFGVMAYNLCTFQMPFVESVGELYEGGSYEIPYPEAVDSLACPPMRKFINRCLAQHPEYRFRDDLALLKALDTLKEEYEAYTAKEAKRKAAIGGHATVGIKLGEMPKIARAHHPEPPAPEPEEDVVAPEPAAPPASDELPPPGPAATAPPTAQLTRRRRAPDPRTDDPDARA